MDEILLTEADVTEALREAYRTVYESSYEWKYACTDKTIATARVVGRAQLRKVVEWMERYEADRAAGFAGAFPVSNFTPRQVDQRKYEALFMANLVAALRAAAEEARQ
jgi:hypothetical protein